MSTDENKKRPLLLTLIVIYIIFKALPRITGTLLILSPSIKETNPEVYAQVQSLSSFQNYSPFILGLLLIISMILLFLLKKNSLIVFAIYLALELITIINKALSPNWIDIFGIKGLYSSLGSFALGAIVLGYMIWLRKQKILN